MINPFPQPIETFVNKFSSKKAIRAFVTFSAVMFIAWAGGHDIFSRSILTGVALTIAVITSIFAYTA